MARESKYKTGDVVRYWHCRTENTRPYERIGKIIGCYFDKPGFVYYQIDVEAREVHEKSIICIEHKNQSPPGPTLAESIVKIGTFDMPPPLIDSVTGPKSSRGLPSFPIAEMAVATIMVAFGALLYAHTGFNPFWLIEKLIQLCLK